MSIRKAVTANTMLPPLYKTLLQAILRTALEFIGKVLDTEKNKYRTDEEMGYEKMHIDLEALRRTITLTEDRVMKQELKMALVIAEVFGGKTNKETPLIFINSGKKILVSA